MAEFGKIFRGHVKRIGLELDVLLARIKGLTHDGIDFFNLRIGHRKATA